MATVVTHPVYAGTQPVVLPKNPNPVTTIHYPGGGVVRTTLTTPVTKKRTTANAAPGTPVNASTHALLSLIQSYRAALLTPAQQAAQAKTQTQQQIDLALAGIRSSTAADQAYQNQQALRAQGFAEALRSMGQTDQQSVASLYNDAANREQALGTGLTGAVADAYKQQSDQSAADTLAATGGLGHIGSVSPDALRNVAQFTGVVLPGKNLAEEAANQGAEARWRDATDAGQIQNIAADYLSKASDDQKQLALQVAQLQQTRPDLYAKALNDLQTNNRSDMATIIQALALVGTQAQIPGKIAQTAAQTAGTQATTKGTNVKTTVTAQGSSGLDVKGNPKPGFHWTTPDPKTRTVQPVPKHQMLDPTDPSHSRTIPNPSDPPPGMHYDPKTGQFEVNPKTGAKKGTSESQVTTIVKTFPATAKTFAIDTTSPILEGQKLKGPVYKPKYSWQVAYNKLLNTVPTDRRNEPRVKQAIINALIQYGYVQPTGKTAKKTTKTTTTKTNAGTTKKKSTTWGVPANRGY